MILKHPVKTSHKHTDVFVHMFVALSRPILSKLNSDETLPDPQNKQILQISQQPRNRRKRRRQYSRILRSEAPNQKLSSITLRGSSDTIENISPDPTGAVSALIRKSVTSSASTAARKWTVQDKIIRMNSRVPGSRSHN